jgi:hypothetical protein
MFGMLSTVSASPLDIAEQPNNFNVLVEHKDEIKDIINNNDILLDKPPIDLSVDVKKEPEVQAVEVKPKTAKYKAEDAVGHFESMTQFYNKVKYTGYSYYNNDIYTQDESFVRLKNEQGLNCADLSQLGLETAKSMGYEAYYVNIESKRGGGGHVFFNVKGHEFSDWTTMDLAAAADSGAPINSHWCPSYHVKAINPKWLESDNGITESG